MKYGVEFTCEQFNQIKKSLRGKIFFLLLIVDPATKDQYQEIDVTKSIIGLLLKLRGMNSLCDEPTQIVDIMCLLESALIEYNSPNFNYKVYRKLILDAGAEVSRLEV